MQEDKLYAVARRCTELSDQGCANDCELCQYNVFNYVKDAREASLLKANAATDYYRAKEVHEQYKQMRFQEQVAPLVFIAVLIGLVMWACSGCVQYKDQHNFKNGLGPQWYIDLDYPEKQYMRQLAYGFENMAGGVIDTPLELKERIADYGGVYIEYTEDCFSQLCLIDGKYLLIFVDRRWLEERPLE